VARLVRGEEERQGHDILGVQRGRHERGVGPGACRPGGVDALRGRRRAEVGPGAPGQMAVQRRPWVVYIQAVVRVSPTRACAVAV
jgi:hypothetical protein